MRNHVNVLNGKRQYKTTKDTDSWYKQQSQNIALFHNSNAKCMVNRFIFYLGMYTSSRDSKQSLRSCDLGRDFFFFLRHFRERERASGAVMLYSVDFCNLNLYKLYNKYFCLTIIYLKETSTPVFVNPTLLLNSSLWAHYRNSLPHKRPSWGQEIIFVS